MNQIAKDKKVPNLNEFIPSKCEDNSRENGKGGISIVNSKVSKRIGLNVSTQELLNNLDTVQIAYKDDVLAISNYIGDELTNYKLKTSGNSKVIYNTLLVNEIVDYFNLDYTDRTSLTFPILKTENINDENVVFIQMC